MSEIYILPNEMSETMPQYILSRWGSLEVKYFSKHEQYSEFPPGKTGGFKKMGDVM